MTKEELFTAFQGMSTDELEKRLQEYGLELSRMVYVEDMASVLDAKEVVETILKERADGVN